MIYIEPTIEEADSYRRQLRAKEVQTLPLTFGYIHYENTKLKGYILSSYNPRDPDDMVVEIFTKGQMLANALMYHSQTYVKYLTLYTQSQKPIYKRLGFEFIRAIMLPNIRFYQLKREI